MSAVLEMLRIRLRLAKDGQQVDRSQDDLEREKDDLRQGNIADVIALPSHALLCTCNSCGVNYAEVMDPADPDEPDGRYCRVCKGKRDKNRDNNKELREARKVPLSVETLWGRVIHSLGKSYLPPTSPLPQRPEDFNVFRQFTHGKDYLGLIYADANNMGKIFAGLTTLQAVKETATQVDKAVFDAMADAVRIHLQVQGDKFPFDILLIGGDDIVIVTPADKAMQVARTLAESLMSIRTKSTPSPSASCSRRSSIPSVSRACWSKRRSRLRRSLALRAIGIGAAIKSSRALILWCSQAIPA